MQKLKKFIFFFVLASFISVINIQAQKTQTYLAEFKIFQNSDAYKILSDDSANDSLKAIHRDIDIYKQLSFFQRAIRYMCFFFEPVIVMPNNLPKLYNHIDAVCKDHNIKTPIIFIATSKGFFNAFATKLLISSGAIVIGKQLIEETSDRELEAVIAHELGHIKYNHVNKALAVSLGTLCASSLGLFAYLENLKQRDSFSGTFSHRQIYREKEAFAVGIYALINFILPALIIGKSHEQEADEFAYKIMDNGDGLKEFFEQVIQKKKTYNEQFDQTYEKLSASKSQLAADDNFCLWARYYLAKGGNSLGNILMWVYYNTPFGAHPSPAARVKAIEEYQNLQKK